MRVFILLFASFDIISKKNQQNALTMSFTLPGGEIDCDGSMKQLIGCKSVLLVVNLVEFFSSLMQVLQNKNDYKLF